MWSNICRVCSSRADYEIFAKIPTYLHASTNEFLCWQKPINILLEETTGLKISPDDGLPSQMCRICISYLKHAVTFREQCVNNSLSLIAVATLQQERNIISANDKKKLKENIFITTKELCFAERSMQKLLLNNSNKKGQQDKVCKELLSQIALNKAENYVHQTGYSNLLFDKNNSVQPDSSTGGSVDSIAGEDEYFTATISSDDYDDGGTINTAKNFYNYREKNFEEDDILDVDVLRKSVKINIPESCKERKCRACCKRFMFEDTFENHLNSCPEYYFFTFVDEVNILLHIRKNKGLSPHEYIRRMIFCIRKTCEWLRKNSIDNLLFDFGLQKESQSTIKNQFKAEEIAGLKCCEKKSLQNVNTYTFTEDKSNEVDFLDLRTHIDLHISQLGNALSPITQDNNILNKIERCASKQIAVTVKRPIPVSNKFDQNGMCSRNPSPVQNSSYSLNVNKTNKLNCFSILEKVQKRGDQKMTRSDSLLTKKTPIFYFFNYSARCNSCNLTFKSVTLLEAHNASFHNTKVVLT